MTPFASALARRAETVGIAVPEQVFPAFETYAHLLSRWNRIVNLTALPIDELAPEALDRLLLEPVAAAGCFPNRPADWIDLGTGGGSPAIPLKVLRPSMRLTMIESRSRKVAFLREAIRQLNLTDTSADDLRFEEILGRDAWSGSVDLVTARAVRPDTIFIDTVRHVLRRGGSLLLFQAESAAPLHVPGFGTAESRTLLAGQSARLSIYKRIN